ncbi:MAG TPA: hypothetical protein PL134_09035 [Smithellaceae bacterium]|jgi:hypothetical protein|nr:MAG: hypothetical protein BWY90_01496 [Deltaproteobacteria bacterium ADurb.BinA014]HOF77225.1 hypothetical protein [Smithellaceae bacterium]HOM70597.1 hypothetical protein [Smithellaceae bacterium]HOS08337.1 hypothetical protein [Smithellaceae bacterium]HOU03704.1 hypothetical protein [Smithellaceae bacterium]
MNCKLCGENKKLIKAHIIPAAFFRPLSTTNKAPEIFSNTNGVFPKRSPTGIYDKDILCEQCDRCIGLWDDYANKILIQNFSEKCAVYHKGIKVAYKIDNYDYKKLKLFFISLLWRALISEREFYKRINISSHEQNLKDMIINKNPGGSYNYAVALAKFSDPKIAVMLDPHKTRFDGINYCQFYLTGFVAYIKTDKRNPPDFLKEFCLKERPPFWIILRDLNNSKDGKIIKDIILKATRKG